jgi:hypothetical protein
MNMMITTMIIIFSPYFINDSVPSIQANVRPFIHTLGLVNQLPNALFINNLTREPHYHVCPYFIRRHSYVNDVIWLKILFFWDMTPC